MAVLVMAQVVAEHLGALHPVEKLLTVVLAFGPFVLLAVVVLIRRRQDAAAEQEPAQQDPAQQEPADGPAAQDSER